MPCRLPPRQPRGTGCNGMLCHGLLLSAARQKKSKTEDKRECHGHRRLRTRASSSSLSLLHHRRDGGTVTANDCLTGYQQRPSRLCRSGVTAATAAAATCPKLVQGSATCMTQRPSSWAVGSSISQHGSRRCWCARLLLLSCRPAFFLLGMTQTAFT